MKSAFWKKLVERLDKMDSGSVQSQFLRLVSERGLLESIFHALREGILVLDADARILYANRGACRLLGIPEAGSAGQLMSRYLHEIDWQRLVSLDEKEWARMATREIEITYPEHRFLAMYLAPLENLADGRNGVIMIVRDVTRERDHTAEAIESERLNAILLLAASVAHEIGNPLNSLTIHLQLLDRELNDLPPENQESLRELLNVARGEIARLDQILTQFLKAIRPNPPNFESAQLPEIVAETLTTLSAEIQYRKIVVEVEPGEDLPPAWVDRAQARQAFFNVIRNAIQAMSAGGGLRISFAVADRLIGVAFQDTGPGIPPDQMTELFEPFQTTKPDGHGMGLMIVQRIMRDHGGGMLVESLPQGTRIQLHFQREDQRIRLLPAPKDARVDEEAP
ncbi:MAG: ATP-binding protein [Kiritimatiellia bacterium]|jgi:two-component system, sporulation sensor kinase E|nr:PAS domain-containing protein [Lentisphaerota bacterium]